MMLLLTLTFGQRWVNNFNVDLPCLRTGTNNQEDPFLLQLLEQKRVFDAVKQMCSTKQRERKVFLKLMRGADGPLAHAAKETQSLRMPLRCRRHEATLLPVCSR